MDYFIVSVGQEFRSGLSRWFCLKISHEVAFIRLVGAAVIWSRKICFQAHSCGCWPTPLPCRVCVTPWASMESLHDKAASYSHNKWFKRENATVFYNWISEVLYHYFFCILLVIQGNSDTVWAWILGEGYPWRISEHPCSYHKHNREWGGLRWTGEWMPYSSNSFYTF